uniref:Uncharacterized protein n=1 Tax=Timema shepardi TaxID=629360 RepID=A0A7R9AK41_TIMSH|nr:unnamed protein product [Timema shepardi]
MMLCTIVSSSLETRHICSVLKCVFGGLDPSSSSCQMKRYRANKGREAPEGLTQTIELRYWSLNHKACWLRTFSYDLHRASSSPVTYEGLEYRPNPLQEAQPIYIVRCPARSSCLRSRPASSLDVVVFSGASDSTEELVVERTLLEIKKKKSPKEMDIISLISNEIDKMEAKHVAHLADLCVDWAQNGTTELVGWKTVLPIVLTHLSDQQFVDAGDKEMKGPEFVSQKIHSLCAVYWKSESVIHLASIDMSLTPEEHKEVVMTLCKCMHRLDPQEVPPLVYLLLNMCKVNHCVTLYMNLDLYFTNKLYKGSLKDTNTVSEALNEVEMDETNVKDSRESEDTVLLHIYDAAMAYPKSIRDLVSFLRNLVCAPELVTRPFIFAVLLAISTIHFHEDMVCDFLKHTILKCFLEEEKRKASQWLRDNITKTTSLELVVNILIQNRVQDNVQVLYGMLNLGFILLDITSVSGNISDLGKLWSLGSHIVLSLVRQESSVISKALEKLSFHISTRGAMKQHFDCLYELSMRVPMAMYECRSEITKMLQNLLYRPSSESECVMKALIPLTKTFPTLKDMLIINLRKGLYSRILKYSKQNVLARVTVDLTANAPWSSLLLVTDPVLKKMSVCGFLIILKQQGLRGMSVLTQSSSVHENLSLHSQNHSNSSFTVDDESTFIEVLAILKICFTKYEEVKVCLYEGLCDSSIYKDPKLFTSIRVMLWSQMLEHYQENELILPPLNFKEAVVVKGIRAVVKRITTPGWSEVKYKLPPSDLANLNPDCICPAVAGREPLAQLVFVNQRIVTNKLIPGQSESLESVTVILESLCDRMTRCTLDDLDMRNNEFLLDNLPECLQKQEVFKMMLGTYEALMSYLVNSWTVETTDQGRKVALLFSSYLQLFELTKKNVLLRLTGAYRTVAIDGLSVTLGVWPLDLLVKKREIGDSVSWSTTEAAKQLKGKRDFRRYIMRVVLSLIQKHSSLKQTDSRSSSNFVEFLQCGSTKDFSKIQLVFFLVLDRPEATITQYKVSFVRLPPPLFSLDMFVVFKAKPNVNCLLHGNVVTMDENMIGSLKALDPVKRKSKTYFVGQWVIG